MQAHYFVSPLIMALALGLSAPANAAEAVHVQKSSLAEIQSSFQMVMPGISQARSISADSLRFVKQHTDKKGIKHVRMQQTYAGFPVFGGYTIMHSLNAVKNLVGTSSDVRMNGIVYKGLQAELGTPSASFLNGKQKALAHFKAQFADQNLTEEQVTPMIYVDGQHHAHWAYKVTLLVTPTDTIPKRPTAIIDAKTFEPFVQWDEVKTLNKPVQGMGYGGNHKIGYFKYGLDLPMLQLTRDADLKLCYMETDLVKVIDMEHKYVSEELPMHFMCMDNETDSDVYLTGYSADGYDQVNGAASPSNDAMYAGNVISKLYQEWYGIPALTNEDGSPMQLVLRVHFGEAYENAFWDGSKMTFGDGEDVLYPLVSLGVAAHEISHGFTHQHSALEYIGQSGGMNESFSDMASQAAEYYSTGTSSWKIGSEIIKEDSGYDALRYMDLPSKDGMSIDRADEYYEGIDVHQSSGVYNHLFYLLAHKPNWNVRKAFDVMVKANMDYWTPYTDYAEGACGVLSAAKDLNYPLEEIKEVLEHVAIDYQGCVV